MITWVISTMPIVRSSRRAARPRLNRREGATAAPASGAFSKTAAGVASSMLCDLTAELVFDMNANDLLEIRFGLEAELAGALGLDPARPAGDDAGDRLVRLAANAACRLFAGDFAQGFDLLAHRHRYSRHAQIAPRAERTCVQRRGVQQKADRRPGRRVRVAHLFRHRQHGRLTDKRLADDIGEETRCGKVRPAGSHAYCRQPDAHSVEKAAPRVIGKKQLADGFLRSVRSEEHT